jgi:hypothetical protein
MIQNIFSSVRNIAHALIPVVGVLTASAAVVAALVAHLGVPTQTTLDLLAALGIGAAVVSKFIDSKSYTTLQTVATQASSGNLLGAVATVEAATATPDATTSRATVLA